MKASLYVFIVFFALGNLSAQNISLLDTTNQYDYVVITIPQFKSACDTFVSHKQLWRNLNVLVVDTSQIFSEFSSEPSDQENIRHFISYAGTNWRYPQPKYFLLAGNTTKLPSFRYYFNGYPAPDRYTDFYFAESIFDADTSTRDFYLGRIPANNETELNNYFLKLINYELNLFGGSWQNRTLMVAQNDTTLRFDDLAVFITNKLPPIIERKLYVADPPNQQYGNKDSIISFINQTGAATVWFSGFNVDSGFISNEYFNINDIEDFSNSQSPFIGFMIGMQDFGTDTSTSLMSRMVLKENGGAVAGIAATSLSWYSYSKLYFTALATDLYVPDNTLGSLLIFDDLSASDPFSSTQRMVMNLWGDPSIQIINNQVVNVRPTEETEILPDKFMLFQNYPNPFNPSTTIKYSIPSEMHVSLKIFDPLGREVKALVEGIKAPGEHQIIFNAADIPSGVYFYLLRTESFLDVKKLMLVK